MGLYSQVFTLKDIFSNKELADRLPYINFKTKEYDEGDIKIRTNVKTVKSQVFNISINTAKPYYTELKPIREQNTLTLDGNLKGSQHYCVLAIADAIRAKAEVLSFTANNANIIREAIKEAESTTLVTGSKQKLWLKVKSIQDIKNLDNKQLRSFMQDVMANLYYGDEYVQTQKKYKIWEQKGFAKDYDTRQREWRRKVGLD